MVRILASALCALLFPSGTFAPSPPQLESRNTLAIAVDLDREWNPDKHEPDEIMSLAEAGSVKAAAAAFDRVKTPTYGWAERGEKGCSRQGYWLQKLETNMASAVSTARKLVAPGGRIDPLGRLLFLVGTSYIEGRSCAVAADDGKALTYLIQSAEHGYREAAELLCTYDGHGEPYRDRADVIDAYKWSLVALVLKIQEKGFLGDNHALADKYRARLSESQRTDAAKAADMWLDKLRARYPEIVISSVPPGWSGSHLLSLAAWR